VSRRKKKDKGGISALISSVVDGINSDFVGTLDGSDSLDLVEEWIPSKSMALNYALGDPRHGAFPVGRVVEIIGPKSSGKSLILYDALAQIQNKGGIGILIDSESSYTKPFGKYLGINNSELIYAHLRTIEEVTDFAVEVIERIRDEDEEVPILLGWDSIAACTTLIEDAQDDVDGKSEMGYRARLMSRNMRKLGGKAARNNLCYVCINQTRKKIGVRFGNPITTPGGEALPFHASMRLVVTRTKKIKKTVGGTKRIVGHKVKVFCEKNKVRPPFAECEINMYVDRVTMRYGLDEWSGLAELLQKDGIVTIRKKIITLVSDTSIKFKESEFPKYWESHILPSIPEDLYLPAGAVNEEEEDGDE
jgi:recombination protein RecA